MWAHLLGVGGGGQWDTVHPTILQIFFYQSLSLFKIVFYPKFNQKSIHRVGNTCQPFAQGQCAKLHRC